MIEGKAAPAANCANPNDKVLALGQKLRIQGTPAIFFADGSRIPGAVDLPTLEKKLESIKQ
jgi:thiol:disulfide interchange protein DsbC